MVEVSVDVNGRQEGCPKGRRMKRRNRRF